jgi:hypothetical protein
MVPRDAIAAGDFATVARLSAEARTLVAGAHA